MKVTTRQLRLLHALWRRAAPSLASDREARLAFASAVLGRSVSSFATLTRDEASRLIEELEREARPSSPPASVFHRPSSFSRAPTSLHDSSHGAGGGFSNIIHRAPSQQQIFMLEQLTRYIGWDRSRVEAFLRRHFRRRAFWALTPRQAWAATRLLLEIAARRDIKRRLGRDHRVSREEITREIPEVKRRIRSYEVQERTGQ